MTPQEQVREEEERAASCPPDAAPARIIVQVEARGGWAWELGDPRRAPCGNSHGQFAATTLLGRQAWQRVCPVLLAPQPENCVMSFDFPRKKPETC